MQDNNCIENQRGHTEEVAINVGGPEYHEYEADIPTSDYSIEMYTNSSTSVWSMSTRGIDGGGVINGSQTLSNAESIDSWPLYNTARTGADSFQYYIHSLVPAKYKVALGFVELNTDVRPGDRIFDIWIQGKLVYQGMDVMVRAQGIFEHLFKPLMWKSVMLALGGSCPSSFVDAGVGL